MQLEGTVTNVTNFGAFVDIGVHQDGLVHISAMSARFIKDPYSVVKAGDVVKVKVMEVDVARKRIALTMRLDDELPAAPRVPGTQGAPAPRQGARPGARAPDARRDAPPPPGGAMAAAFAKVKV